jgi:hypothetical protein
MVAGVRATRYAITPKLIRNEAHYGGPDMRGLRMDRTREYPGRPDILGSDGAHVRKVPKTGADRESCSVGHVAPAASLWF